MTSKFRLDDFEQLYPTGWTTGDLVMARESRRKREARRFGVSERLADWAAELPWRKPYFAEGCSSDVDQAWQDMAALCQERIPSAVVVDAADVGEYFFAETPKDEWNYRTDFPSCLPPFPRMFVEFRRPSRILCEGAVLTASHLPPAWGWYFETKSRDEFVRELTDPVVRAEMVAILDRKLRLLLPQVDRAALAAMDLSKSPEELMPTLGPIEQTFVGSYVHYLRLKSDQLVLPPESICWYVQANLIICREDRRAIIGPFLSADYQLDVRGQVIGSMCFSPVVDANRANYVKEAYEIRDYGHSILFPALLAISFMHCKRGVAMPTREPDPVINAARIQAGKQPFVRYRTILIGPMKEVLRSEGGVDKHGLRRALHLVRGHFATYTEERPLFGRIVGTVWRTAHVRGSETDGIVVSDYRVDCSTDTRGSAP